jgi:hypothetical protein
MAQPLDAETKLTSVGNPGAAFPGVVVGEGDFVGVGVVGVGCGAEGAGLTRSPELEHADSVASAQTSSTRR